MERRIQSTLSPEEEAQFCEFKRARRETEARLTIEKIAVDGSMRESDREDVKRLAEEAKRSGAYALVVSPVQAAFARRCLAGSKVKLSVVVGGTGESVLAVKRKELKKALSDGAEEIRLVPCYSAIGSNPAYLKKEIKKTRKSAKDKTFVVCLDDHAFTVEQVCRAVTVAAEAKADAVSVRAECEFVLPAVKAAAAKIGVYASRVENGEQLRLLIKAGISRVTCRRIGEIAREFFEAIGRDCPTYERTRTEAEETEKDRAE